MKKQKKKQKVMGRKSRPGAAKFMGLLQIHEGT